MVHRASAETPAPFHPAVIELFTSQGCSSCPAADRVLGELAKRPDILALSFPVTYWDYLGWKDTLARPEYSERQRKYSSTVSDGQVYTPQAVVNGIESCVGSSQSGIEAAIRQTNATAKAAYVSLAVKREAGRLLIETGAAPQNSAYRTGAVFVAAVRRSTAVSIARGENAGRRVTYTNAVRTLTAAGDWQGLPTAYVFPLPAATGEDDDYVVFLQAPGLGPIVAAAKISG